MKSYRYRVVNFPKLKMDKMWGRPEVPGTHSYEHFDDDP